MADLATICAAYAASIVGAMGLQRVDGTRFSQAAMLAVCMSMTSDFTHLVLGLFGFKSSIVVFLAGVLGTYISIPYTGLREGHLPRVAVYVMMSMAAFSVLMALLEVLKWML